MSRTAAAALFMLAACAKPALEVSAQGLFVNGQLAPVLDGGHFRRFDPRDLAKTLPGDGGTSPLLAIGADARWGQLIESASLLEGAGFSRVRVGCEAGGASWPITVANHSEVSPQAVFIVALAMTGGMLIGSTHDAPGTLVLLDDAAARQRISRLRLEFQHPDGVIITERADWPARDVCRALGIVYEQYGELELGTF